MELELIEDLGMLYPTEKSSQKKRFGLYKCFCGNKFKAQVCSIRNGNTKSCGCYHSEVVSQLKLKHNLTNHRMYPVWSNMLKRCNNKKHKQYIDYGGRGITVCDRWNDIGSFIEDMDSSFQEGLTLDRIDNDGNYEPNNCRWATKSIQSRNSRRIRSTNKSGYRGVSLYKRYNKYASSIGVNDKNIRIGYFDTALEAAIAYDNYVTEHNLEHTKNFN